MSDIYSIRLGPCFQCGESPCECEPAPQGGHIPASRIPPDALAAVERVLAHRAAIVAEVPGQERWRQTTTQHQAAKCASHALEVECGVTEDPDTGEHPLAHAAARALLGLALHLERAKR